MRCDFRFLEGSSSGRATRRAAGTLLVGTGALDTVDLECLREGLFDFEREAVGVSLWMIKGGSLNV